MLPTRALACVVGFVFQDPESHSVSTTVEDEIAFGMEQLGVPVPAMRRRVEEALDLTGTERIRKRSIGTLSGGERQRVAIAAALALQPRFWLWMSRRASSIRPARKMCSMRSAGSTRSWESRWLWRNSDSSAWPGSRTGCAFARRDGSISMALRAEVLRECDARVLPPVALLGRIEGWDPLPLTVKDTRRMVARLGFEPAVSPVDSPRPDARRRSYSNA